jgi:metallo-beta-lactamase class B
MSIVKAAGMAALIAFASPVYAQTPAPTPVPAPSQADLIARLMKTWATPTPPFQMIGNIYYVGSEGLASYIIKTTDGLILIDTLMPQSTALIEDSMRQLGFKVSDIKLMLNTHGHLDHTGGLAQIKKESGATLVAGARDKPLLESGTYPGDEQREDLKFPPVTVDRTVQDGDRVTLGDVTLVARATPGHSPGCTSWETRVQDGGQDRSVLFFCSGTVALNRLVGRPTYPGIVDDYRATFAKAKTMKVDVLLAPHPEMYGMAAKRAAMKDGAPNPFVKPDEFGIYIAALEQDFDKQLARQQAALGK